MDFRVILHLDLDAFYCQVEHKRLDIDRSVPLAVRQWQGLIAVNYPAKALGIKRFHDIAEAKGICPSIRLIHVETIGKRRGPGPEEGSIGEVHPDKATSKASLARYRKASFEVIKIMQKFSNFIERASIDEVYIDVTGMVDERLQQRGTTGTAEHLSWEDSHVAEGAVLNVNTESDVRLIVGAAICKEIRDAIKRETGYDMSAGISHNKMLSKLASAMNKPNKQTIVSSSAIPSLMKQLPFTSINGLGGKLGDKLKMHFPQDQTAGDLQQYDVKVLQGYLGEKSGSWLHALIRGSIDDPVKPNVMPKSLNACKSFTSKGNIAVVKHWLEILCFELLDRLHQDCKDFERVPKNLVLHARSANTFEERSRQTGMPGNGSIPTQQGLFQAALGLFQKVEKECLPCSRLSVGTTDFVKQQKNRLSNFFSSSSDRPSSHGNHQNGNSNSNNTKKAGGIDLFGKRKDDQSTIKRKIGNFQLSHVVEKDERSANQQETKRKAQLEESDPDPLSGIDIHEQKYILSLIQTQSSKKAKTKERASGQKNLSQFWSKSQHR
jgi:DNA polymerase eta